MGSLLLYAESMSKPLLFQIRSPPRKWHSLVLFFLNYMYPLSTLPCRPVGEGPGCIRRSQWKKWTKQTDIRTRQITEKLSELPNTQSDGCFWKVRWADVDSCDERKETDLAPGKYDESEPSKSEFRKWDDDLNIVCTPATRWRNMKKLGLWFG